ncbi:conserved hypothetical phage-related protein [Clostridium botulinum C str. Eklund]|nr:conserved hypothetical phage-related protein [Clostridium botulinum C str. Eklund]
MFLSEQFEYNGISSDTMGVSCISVDTSGMKESPFGIKRNIQEEQINGRDIPYFNGFEKECLTFKMTIGKINEDDLEWTFDERKKIAEWLYTDYYAPLLSLDNPEVIYYCTPIDDGSRFDNGLFHGYITVTMKCNAPYPFSPTYIEQYNHKQAISDIIEINNLSNISKYYYPEIQVHSEDTSFKLVNLTNGGEELAFSNIDKGETIYINNQMKQIESDKKDFKGNKVYRLSNFNKNWFKLVKGINRIKVVGDVDVIFRCSYPITI